MGKIGWIYFGEKMLNNISKDTSRTKNNEVEAVISEKEGSID